MTATTLPGVLLHGVAGSRPAASAVASGTLYSATDTGVVTQSDGVSTWTTYLTAGTFVSPLTTRGDLLYENASPAAARLAIGAAGKILTSDGTDVSWGNGPMTASGDIIYGGTAGTPTRLAKGSDTQVLTLASGAPSWATPAAGGAGALVFLEAHTASNSATLDFTTFISSTYDQYQFSIVDLVAATNNATLNMRMGTGGGPTYDAGANYGSSTWATQSGGAAAGGSAGGASSIVMTRNGISSGGLFAANGTLRLYDPQSATLYKMIEGQIAALGASVRIIEQFIGTYESATAVTAIRFLMSAGNITSGIIRVYGITKS